MKNVLVSALLIKALCSILILLGLISCAPAPVNTSNALRFDGNYQLVSTTCVATPAQLFIELGIIRELPAVSVWDASVTTLTNTGLLSIKGASDCVATFQRGA